MAPGVLGNGADREQNQEPGQGSYTVDQPEMDSDSRTGTSPGSYMVSLVVGEASRQWVKRYEEDRSRVRSTSQEIRISRFSNGRSKSQTTQEHRKQGGADDNPAM